MRVALVVVAFALLLSPVTRAVEVSPAWYGLHFAGSSVGLPGGMEFATYSSTPVPFFLRTWVAGGDGLIGAEFGGIIIDRITVGASFNLFRTDLEFEADPKKNTTDNLAGIGGHLGFLAFRDTSNVLHAGVALESSGIIGSPIAGGLAKRISVNGMHRFGNPAGYGVGVYGGAGVLFGNVGETAKNDAGSYSNVIFHVGVAFAWDFSNGN